MRAKTLPILILLFTQVACGAPRGGSSPKVVSENPQTLQQVVKPTALELEVRKKLDEEIEQATKAGCVFKDRYSKCKTAQVDFAPAQARNDSEGQRILVLDSAFITFSLLTRHRDRVLDLLVQESGASYRRAAPRFRMPELAVKLNDILRSAQGPVRTETLGDAGETLAAMAAMATQNTSSEATGTTHGEIVFETLAKYIPKAQFLIAPFPVIDEKLYCQLGREEAVTSIRNFYVEAAGALIPRIRELKITHANISWAITDSSAKQKFDQMCGHYPDEEEIEGLNALVLAEANFVHELTKRTGILVVQSAPNNYEGRFDRRKTGSAWSCFKNPQILSVGYLGFLRSDLSAQGSPIDERWIPYQQKSSAGCTDLFVNGGINEIVASQAKEDYKLGFGTWWTENSFIENYYSFTSTPARMLSNSWLTPVALSMIIHMEQTAVRSGAARPTPAQMTQAVRGSMFDPLANHQTELHKEL